MAVSRRKKKPIVVVDNEVLALNYCRKCQKSKKDTDFFTATDTFLDTNGKMSVCKDCCNEMYSNFFRSEQGSMEKALLKTCRTLNVRYDEAAVQATLAHLATVNNKGKVTENIFGIYKNKIVSVQKTRISKKGEGISDLTFFEPSKMVAEIPNSTEEIVDLKQFWGENFAYEEYIFLEKELAEWKKTHKADTKAEIMLLKELCYKGLEIRKARTEERSTGALVKELQELMKTASVDPSKTSQAGSGKANDTFSSFIQIIENTEPAEYYQDKELFKDFDNIDNYFRKYVLRPLKNFLTGTRDFDVSDDGEDDELYVEEIDALEDDEGVISDGKT